MLYYFMSQIRASAFERSAAQFLRLVQESGTSAILVTADGMAPDSIMSNVPVLDERSAVDRLMAGDLAVVDDPIFALAHSDRPATWFLHDQQLDALRPLDSRTKRFMHPQLLLGRAASAPFHYSGQIKYDDTISVDVSSSDKRWGMCFNQWPMMDYLDAGDGNHELEVADRLCRSNFYLMIEPQRSLQRYVEAMAAGTILLVADNGQVPGELVQHAVNAWIFKPKKLLQAIGWMLQPEQSGQRMSLRHGAIAAALYYNETNYVQQIRGFLRDALNRQVAA